jgi:uncharacterized protein (DUF433 family)
VTDYTKGDRIIVHTEDNDSGIPVPVGTRLTVDELTEHFVICQEKHDDDENIWVYKAYVEKAPACTVSDVFKFLACALAEGTIHLNTEITDMERNDLSFLISEDGTVRVVTVEPEGIRGEA